MNKSKKVSMPLQFSMDGQLKGERVGIPLGDITPEQEMMREAKMKNSELGSR